MDEVFVPCRGVGNSLGGGKAVSRNWDGRGVAAKASFIKPTSVFRCLKFSMYWADWVSRPRILWGTELFAVSRATKASGVAGTA